MAVGDSEFIEATTESIHPNGGRPIVAYRHLSGGGSVADGVVVLDSCCVR
jgi:hypothetical protein